MGKIVPIKGGPQRVSFAPGPLFEKAWQAFPSTGRIRSSRQETAPQWAAVAARIGEQALLDAVVLYAKAEAQHSSGYGAPGFHKWLEKGRWEYWHEMTERAPAPSVHREFPEPQLRASFHEAFPSAQARRWLDRCEWDARTREIVNPGQTLRLEWIMGPFTEWCRANGVVALVQKAPEP